MPFVRSRLARGESGLAVFVALAAFVVAGGAAARARRAASERSQRQFGRGPDHVQRVADSGARPTAGPGRCTCPSTGPKGSSKAPRRPAVWDIQAAPANLTCPRKESNDIERP